MRQRLDVEARSTANNDGAPASLDIIHARCRQLAKHSNVELFVRIDDIDDVVRNPFSLGFGRFPGSDVHITVHQL